MKNVKLLAFALLDGEVHSPGAVVSVTDHRAAELVKLHHAEDAPDGAVPANPADPESDTVSHEAIPAVAEGSFSPSGPPIPAPLPPAVEAARAKAEAANAARLEASRAKAEAANAARADASKAASARLLAPAAPVEVPPTDAK